MNISGALVGRVCWHKITSMQIFDSQYWNLSQAAAWVVYRKLKLVEQFSTETADGWGALLLYPKMHGYEQVGDLSELVQALILGKLEAWGRRNDINDKLEAIPAREWAELSISPPSAKRSHPVAGLIEPWTGLRFESKDLKKLWRGLPETEGRTRYKWDVLKNMWREINKRLPGTSQNERILELQMEYDSRFGDDSAPARTTIQNHIKRW